MSWEIGIGNIHYSSVGKESACNVGDLGSIPELGRSSGEGNSYPFQYSGLENSMDRGAWQATLNHTESDMTEATQPVYMYDY